MLEVSDSGTGFVWKFDVGGELRADRRKRPWSLAPACAGFYSIVKELRRGERLVGDEPRALRTIRLRGRVVRCSEKGQTRRSVLLTVYRTGKSALAVCVLFSCGYRL
jgi:hypothetical protein